MCPREHSDDMEEGPQSSFCPSRLLTLSVTLVFTGTVFFTPAGLSPPLAQELPIPGSSLSTLDR